MFDDYDPYEQDDAYDEQEDTQQEMYDPMQQPYDENQGNYDNDPAAQWTDQPEIISTSQAVNLTSTIASFSLLMALFLCFADQRSRAIRRFAVQSIGLGAVHIGIGFACWLVDMLLGWVPLLGRWLHLMLIAIFIAVSILVLSLRVVMMFHAYRGEAYTLPIFGASLRRFE